MARSIIKLAAGALLLMFVGSTTAFQVQPGLAPRAGLAPHVHTQFNSAPLSVMKASSAPAEETALDAINEVLVETLKGGIDIVYGKQGFARFYALETVARVPYFAYMSVLHLYESFGLWRKADYLKTHFEESWNELHHLLIMEELGGNDKVFDRILAQTAAFIYYWLVVVIYFLSPQFAYNLNKKVEQHAWKTYDEFLTQEEAQLKTMPVPEAARQYYEKDAMFDPRIFAQGEQMNTGIKVAPQKRPAKMNNLYDVFMHIREDEAEHAFAMEECEQDAITGFKIETGN